MLSADVIYTFSLDTTPLAGSAAAPFSLAFQLSDGSGTGDGNNAAILQNFQFGGGAPVGAPLLLGGALGDLTTSVVLTDALGIGYLSQEFTPGSTLQFQLDLTTNLDSGATPDAFTFSILDSTLAPIPTTAGFPFDMLAEIDIDSDRPAVTSFSGDTTRSPAGGGNPIGLAAPAISVSPEPSSAILLITGIIAVLAARRLSARG